MVRMKSLKVGEAFSEQESVFDVNYEVVYICNVNIVIFQLPNIMLMFNIGVR
jgi:hypothetical protein